MENLTIAWIILTLPTSIILVPLWMLLLSIEKLKGCALFFTLFMCSLVWWGFYFLIK